MARQARAENFDPHVIGVYHCINRCVRRAFLCGVDPYTGNDYSHREEWIRDRLEFLATYYGIDVVGYSVLGNHFHVILRNRPDVVEMWSDQDVARRWLMLCPIRKSQGGDPLEPTDAEIGMIVNDPERLKTIRTRLSDISWLMRMVAEKIACRANREDDVTGRFWQGRFKLRELCTPAAILACLMYVDLNPIRAGIAATPEESRFTSAHARAADLVRGGSTSGWLSPLELDDSQPPGPMPDVSGRRCSDKGVLPLSIQDYLMLLDWTGRHVADGKTGAIPKGSLPILTRLGVDAGNWLQLVTRFDQLFYRVVGSPGVLHQRAAARGRRWYQAPGGALLTATTPAA